MASALGTTGVVCGRSNVQPHPKKEFPWWDNMVEGNTNVPTGTTRQEARLENSLAMIGSSPRKS